MNKSITNWLKNSALTGHTGYLEKLKKTVGRKFGSREALDTIVTAAQHGHTGYIRKLIEQGVDVNLKNKEGNGALHFAARYVKSLFITECHPQKVVTYKQLSYKIICIALSYLQ